MVWVQKGGIKVSQEMSRRVTSRGLKLLLIKSRGQLLSLGAQLSEKVMKLITCFT